MAQTTITGLPNASTPLDGTERVPMDQGGVTRDASTAQIAALATATATRWDGGSVNLDAVLGRTSLGLGNVNNTSDANKPISTATATALAGKAGSGAISQSGLTMATARLLGRSTTGTGAPEEIALGNNLTLAGGILSASVSLDTIDTQRLTILNQATFEGGPYDEIYSYAFTDSLNQIAWGVRIDGTLFANKTADLNISGNAATATTTATATTVTRVDFIGGDTQAADQSYAETMEWAVVDSTNRIALGIKKSGALVIPSVQPYVTFGQAHGATGLYSVAVDTFGKAQIQLGGNNGVVTLTSEGNNWSPVVTAETSQRVAFQSDRVDGVLYWVMNSDGTRQAQAIPSKNNITFWGDSMTQRLQNYGHLPGLLPGRTITYNALGGTSVEHIIARQGGENATCTIPSGSIPASGSVALRNVWPSLGLHAGTSTVGATFSYRVSIAEVQGTLTSTTNASGADYTFTRTNTGAAVSVTGPVEITVLSNISDNPYGFSKNNTAVFWMGTNALSGLPSSSYNPNTGTGIYLKSPTTTYDPTNSAAVQSRTEALTQALINRVENLDRHVLIVGGFVGQGQVWSSITEKTAMNAAFSTFSKHWYDLRANFIGTCKTWLQTNHPAVYANWAATDDTHVANGASPPILREDSIHLNTYGSQLVSQLIASNLSSKQW